MEFMVRRTSEHDSKPCKEAYQKSYTRIDERTVNDPMKNPHIGAEWYTKGSNHRVERGHIKRDFEATGWFIQFDTLDDLMKFGEKYGSLVIEPCWDNPSITQVEIYDYYRE